MTNQDPQSLASKQGYIGEDLAEVWLIDNGFSIDDRGVKLNGVEADFMVQKDDDGWFVTVKASWRGKRPGLIRTDTLRKAIAEAWLVKTQYALKVLVLTSHVPTKGVAHQALRVALREELFDRVEVLTNGR